jgi:Protein of unknown function (DUF2508)
MNRQKNEQSLGYLTENLDEHQLLLQEIQKAHMDWVTAQSMFDYVVEPDEIDHIIYLINAAEKKYMSLYKRAKQLYK